MANSLHVQLFKLRNRSSQLEKSHTILIKTLIELPAAILTPAFSATLASSAVVTSIIIPPLAICANPALTLKVPVMEKQNYAHEMMLAG